MTPTPGQDHQRLLEARREARDRLDSLHLVLSNSRLAAFLAGLAVAWLTVVQNRASVLWVLLPAAVFLILLSIHDRVLARRRRLEAACGFHESALARLEDRWVGEGRDGAEFLAVDHPYERDLDLFGRGSLFQRLGGVPTDVGRRTLASWLKAGAPQEEVAQRQQAVEELASRLELREELHVLATVMERGLDLDRFENWKAAAPWQPWSGLAPLLAASSLVSLATLVLWSASILGPTPSALALTVHALLLLTTRLPAGRVLADVDRVRSGAELLASVLERLEGEHFDARRLRELQVRLCGEGAPLSARLRRLAGLSHLAESRRNLVFAPLALLLHWGPQLALRIEGWRRLEGASLTDRLVAFGEMEALAALAAYRFENPADVFPEIRSQPAPGITAEGLGHPLIPLQRLVRNDVDLDGDAPLLVVSGSNMSGKSTLLRALGVNVVLALAGAPVRANRFVMTPVLIGASIRVDDSLGEGRSRFSTEVARIRTITGLAGGAPPLLFLLDELFAGTNSHDRLAGAEAVIRGLLDRGGIGLVTTHDLALARLADQLRGRNVHFEDHMGDDGQIAFDYRMREGVVARSNALALMRAAGLDV